MDAPDSPRMYIHAMLFNKEITVEQFFVEAIPNIQ